MSLSILGIAVFLALPSQQPPPGSALASIVDAELAFAKMSETTGMRSAFLANLADDSIVLQPAPVDGRKAHQDSPDIPAMLQWRPIFADASSGGDLGYTTGPWVFRGSATDPPIHGHYVTVWKKQPDGKWKVVVDGGVSHPEPTETGGELESSLPGGEAVGATPDVSPLESLLEADRNLSRASVEGGFSAALLSKAAESARFYRPGGYPKVGLHAIREALAGEPEAWSWEPSGGDASPSGDLGYTYGIAKAAKDATNPRPGAANAYLRIWKRDSRGDWKVVLDLANPLPASEK